MRGCSRGFTVQGRIVNHQARLGRAGPLFGGFGSWHNGCTCRSRRLVSRLGCSMQNEGTF